MFSSLFRCLGLKVCGTIPSNDSHRARGSARNSSSWLRHSPNSSQRTPDTSALILPHPGLFANPRLLAGYSSHTSSNPTLPRGSFASQSLLVFRIFRYLFRLNSISDFPHYKNALLYYSHHCKRLAIGSLISSKQ